MPPRTATVKDYRRYFSDRLTKLNDGGLYHFEHSLGTGLWVVTPVAGGDWSDQIHDHFLRDFTKCLENISGQTFRVQVLREADCERLATRLGQAEPSTAVIVFDERQADGAAYFLLSHALRDWRLKRITRRVIQRTWRAVQDARGSEERQRCEREWNDVILHCVLDTLTQMDAVPWRLTSWPYDAGLVIDVSDGRKFFALSFLLCRDESQRPGFWQYADAWPKPDPGHDAINGVVLQDRVAKLLDSYTGSSFAPIRSLLVLRDGRTAPGEEAALRQGLDRWRSGGQLLPDATIDFVDCHKRSVKDLRMWEAGAETNNILEGRAVYLDGQAALVSCTGAATLPRSATAEPMLLIGRPGVDMRRASSAVFALAQLNFASPKKAHRDPQPLRVADAVLKDRMAVETRGLR
jgi:hypothetical protein